MAFISEIHWRSSEVPPNEFIEIALPNDADPANFTIAFYANSELSLDVEATGVTGGLVTLDNPAVSSAPDPDHPAHYTIYTITSTSALGRLISVSHKPEVLAADQEANAVALIDNSTGDVIDAYSIRNFNPVEFSNGPALGTTPTDLKPMIDYTPNGDSIQADHLGNIANITRSPNDADVICFGSKTLIETKWGLVMAGEIQKGDLVKTMSAGFQPVLWVGKVCLSSNYLTEHPNTQPIRIKKDALGKDLPKNDLIVSPQHRILANSKIVQRMFGQRDALIAARKMLPMSGVEIATDITSIEYVHLLCENHEIIYAEGVAAETLLLGPIALATLEPQERAEIECLLPLMKMDKQTNVKMSARALLPKGKLQKNLIARHVKNHKSIQTAIHSHN